ESPHAVTQGGDCVDDEHEEQGDRAAGGRAVHRVTCGEQGGHHRHYEAPDDRVAEVLEAPDAPFEAERVEGLHLAPLSLGWEGMMRNALSRGCHDHGCDTPLPVRSAATPDPGRGSTKLQGGPGLRDNLAARERARPPAAM